MSWLVPETGSKRSKISRSNDFLKTEIRRTCGVLLLVSGSFAMCTSSRIMEINGVTPLPPLNITSFSYLCYVSLKINAFEHITREFNLFCFAYLWKWFVAGPYGPSSETWRWLIEGRESCSYSFCDQFPSHFITTLNFSGSRLLLEVILNGCHWSFDMLDTFTKIKLVGLYFSPAKRKAKWYWK